MYFNLKTSLFGSVIVADVAKLSATTHQTSSLGCTHFPCGCSRSAVLSFLHFCLLCATRHYDLWWSLHRVRQLLSHPHLRGLPWILTHYRIPDRSQISPLFQSYLNVLSALNYNRILIPILSSLGINHQTDVATPLKLHHWKSVLISLVHLTLILIIFLYLLFLIWPQHLTLSITVYTSARTWTIVWS